jgi:hypothetical protein
MLELEIVRFQASNDLCYDFESLQFMRLL